MRGLTSMPFSYTNDYYYDVQLPINHVISKTVLHLMAICITSQKHSKHMLKVCRKFSKENLIFKLLFLIFVIEVKNNHKKFILRLLNGK